MLSQALVGLAPGREGSVAGGQRPVVEQGGKMQGCPPLLAMLWDGMVRNADGR